MIKSLFSLLKGLAPSLFRDLSALRDMISSAGVKATKRALRRRNEREKCIIPCVAYAHNNKRKLRHESIPTEVFLFLSAKKSRNRLDASLLIWAFLENQMLAKIHIVIPIEKEIISALENRFSFVDCISQRKIWRKTFGLISILIPYHFYASLLANKVAYFRYCPLVVVDDS